MGAHTDSASPLKTDRQTGTHKKCYICIFTQHVFYDQYQILCCCHYLLDIMIYKLTSVCFFLSAFKNKVSICYYHPSCENRQKRELTQLIKCAWHVKESKGPTTYVSVEAAGAALCLGIDGVSLGRPFGEIHWPEKVPAEETPHPPPQLLRFHSFQLTPLSSHSHSHPFPLSVFTTFGLLFAQSCFIFLLCTNNILNSLVCP